MPDVLRMRCPDRPQTPPLKCRFQVPLQQLFLLIRSKTLNNKTPVNLRIQSFAR